MLDQTKLRAQQIELLGDVHSFAEQLGSIGGLSELDVAPSIPLSAVDTVAGLRRFLQEYSTEILVAWEVPAIFRAYGHASRYEVRELIALDVRLSREPALQRFANASQQVGAAQLKKLRPLRDQRLVQRYVDAVENAEAHGSHLVAYGVILSLYSIPLRQGLISYGQQTLRTFIHLGGSSLKLCPAERERLLDDLTEPLPAMVDFLLRKDAFPGAETDGEA